VRNGDGRRLGTNAGGDLGGWGGNDIGWGGWWNGLPLNPEDIRQWQGEVRQWTRDAQQLRGLIKGIDNIDPADLERILAMLKQLEDPRTYQNVEELTRLQSAVTESLKRFEYDLRREVSDENAIALSGSDEVPEKYRSLAENYFRSLGRPSK
jgi:hypothetical protein